LRETIEMGDISVGAIDAQLEEIKSCAKNISVNIKFSVMTKLNELSNPCIAINVCNGDKMYVLTPPIYMKQLISR
jgi:hypothetical protein